VALPITPVNTLKYKGIIWYVGVVEDGSYSVSSGRHYISMLGTLRHDFARSTAQENSQQESYF
jgi:hypothetical protein